MAEEQKKPEEETVAETANELEETAEDVVSEVEAVAEDATETVEQASVEAQIGLEMLAEDIEEAVDSADEQVEEVVDDTENKVDDLAGDADEEADNFVEVVAETGEEAIEDVFEEAESALESIEEAAQSPEIMVAAEELIEDDGHGHQPHYTDDVVLPYFGHVATMPGGIYTFIFGVLGVITLVEVLMTELLPENALTIFLLVVLSLAKAYLVIMYYMHLNNDNPIYRVVILLPLLVVLVSVLYLLGVPAGAGLGYN